MSLWIKLPKGEKALMPLPDLQIDRNVVRKMPTYLKEEKTKTNSLSSAE